MIVEVLLYKGKGIGRVIVGNDADNSRHDSRMLIDLIVVCT